VVDSGTKDKKDSSSRKKEKGKGGMRGNKEKKRNGQSKVAMEKLY